MLYCTHCGKRIDEHKVEKKAASEEIYSEQMDGETKVAYVCPRCGWLVHKDVSEEEKKSLAAASHAEIQKGRNAFAQGMSFNMIALILLVLSYVFFLLSHKANNQNRISYSAPEFWVFVVLLAVGALLLIAGIVLTVLGVTKRKHYEKVLLALQNQTFYQ